MPGEAISTSVSEVSFKDLKMRPGTLVQIEPESGGIEAIEAQFIAVLPGKGIMLSPHEIAEEPAVGENHTIRGFTGQYDFIFSASVLQNFKAPFAYALFAYPQKVKARLVRKAMRMKALLPATIGTAGRDGALPVTLLDFSVAGAMIKVPHALGANGESLELGFSFDVDDSRINLKLAAQIAHSGDTPDGYRVGLMFTGLSANDKMALRCFAASLSES